MRETASFRQLLLAATAVAVVTAILYRLTMLPGVDLGDSPSFQTMGGSTFISPRDAYPLYFAFGLPFVWASGDPALGMNLASVIAAALACGVLVLLSMELSGSVLASVVAALTFASAFTFWSQAVTTEVYALHMLCLAAALLALLSWERRPSDARLTLFFFTYAVGFGNHLTMILLAPAALLMLATSPGGGRRLWTRRVALSASLCVAAGAAPYLWNVRTMVLDPFPPEGVLDTLARFWFDVTKADWRDTMVLEVPGSMLGERWRMLLFDLRQQFSWPSLLFAAIGGAALLLEAPRRFLLLAFAFIAFVTFALTYSVGDTHVFLLPGHLLIAVTIAPGLAWLAGLVPERARLLKFAPALVALLLAVLRLYSEYPALDRSADQRARRTLDALAGDLDDRRALLLADLDWQLMNGLNYYAAKTRNNLLYRPLAEVLSYFPTLVQDNEAIGRAVFVTPQGATRLQHVYGPLFTTSHDLQRPVRRLSERVADIPDGVYYALCVLKPAPGNHLDGSELGAVVSRLSGGRLSSIPAGDYVVVAGAIGAAPALVHAADEPFTRNVQLDSLSIRVRMDAWLTFDTIRRMGFGQVLSGRHHALIVERGVSLVAIGAHGQPLRTEYDAGLYAPPVRLRLTRAALP